MLRTPTGRISLAVLGVIGVSLVLSLFGPYPIGGDPDLMYKPIKSELKRSLEAGQLPFWSVWPQSHSRIRSICLTGLSCALTRSRHCLSRQLLFVPSGFSVPGQYGR